MLTYKMMFIYILNASGMSGLKRVQPLRVDTCVPKTLNAINVVCLKVCF